MLISKPIPFTPFAWIPVGEVYEPIMPMEKDALWKLFVELMKGKAK